MFHKVIIEIISRVENLIQNKKSIIELDLKDINEEIQETLFNIDFTEEALINEELTDIDNIKSLNVTIKEAFGLFFLAYLNTLRDELSYNSFWVGVEDSLLEFEEDENTFFVENYFDDNEPNLYLNEAIIEAIKRFNLRDGYDNGRPTDTILLQMGLLKRCDNLNYWLTSTSKNTIIENLTNRTHENFSKTFLSGWKVLQRYSQRLLSQVEAIDILSNNVWFKDFNLEELLVTSRVNLHSNLISRDEIKSDFFLKDVHYKNEKLEFILSGDDFYSLNLEDKSYQVFIDGELKSKLLKDRTTGIFSLENNISITEPKNYKTTIEIRDENNNINHHEEFILFDFNHDILIFDEDGNYYLDPNVKLDDTKEYSILIDSDFELGDFEDNVLEYFDGYVHLVNNITKDSQFSANDGDEYTFNLNFTEQIKSPIWLNNLELFAISDFLSFEEPIEYKLKYNKIAVSARQSDELIDIPQDINIVRWSYTGGMVYDLDGIVEFSYKMDLTHDILINRKNSLKIKIGERVFTKQLNVTLIEKTLRPKYRTFLKNSDDNIRFLKESNRLTQNDIKDNQLIITSFHEELITKPELRTQVLRDKSNLFDKIVINKPFTLTNYPYYGEELSSVGKIYDDVRWNTFCSIRIKGRVKSYDDEISTITLNDENNDENLTLLTLDKSYNLKSSIVEIKENKIVIDSDILGFCLLKDSCYVGSYFIDEQLEIETIFSSIDVLKFLRLAYFPFAQYFNGTEYEKNRMVREKARHDKKLAKRKIRTYIRSNPSIFLKAFMDDTFEIDDVAINMNFEHSKIITEQILFAIEFDKDESLKIIQEIILNRWQNKLIQLPMFLLFILNRVESDRYYDIFLDELSENTTTPNDVDEVFIERMIKALLSNHKIDKFEKINIKTITQGKNKDFYIKKAIEKIIEIANTPVEEDEDTDEDSTEE